MRALILSGVLFCLVACSEEPASSTTEVVRSSVERSNDPRIVKLRDDLDYLREVEAIEGVLALSEDYEEFERVAGIESFLLRARVHGLRGDLTSAQPLIEQAWQRAPNDPRVYATAVELYAAPGQFETATGELKEGLSRCGMTAELKRAQGVLLLCTGRVGSAKRGLEKLKEAVSVDPDLPFTKKPLAQAYLLVARQELAEGEKEKALADIRASLEYDPTDMNACRFYAEALSAVHEHDKAAKVLKRLLVLGQPVTAELALTYKKAGTQALVSDDRLGALEYFMAARELGLDDEELGFGKQALRDEAAKEVALGLTALRESDLGEASARFTQALEYDPKGLAARNHLAVVQFRMSDFPDAIDNWRTVLFEASELGVALPDPVHINLAKALMRIDDSEGAVLTLKDYLLVEPFGEYVDQTRELVALIEEN